jgi:hypothetical protein
MCIMTNANWLIMRSRHTRNSRPKVPNNLIFPNDSDLPSVRERKLIVLSVLLGLIFCALFGGALFILNLQGRL